MTETQSTPYQQLGGAAGVRALVDRFYTLMDSLPQARKIRALHPSNLTESRNKLYLCLSGWLGGPPLYEQHYGHPRLRARHLPFSIGVAERDEWLRCMSLAMDEMPMGHLLRVQLDQAFRRTSDFIRNHQDDEIA